MPSDAEVGELRDALARSGCAVCHLADRSVVRYMRSVSYEQVNDIALREKLRASRGFCTTHAHRWLREAKSVLGTALIYRDAMTAALRELDAPRHASAGNGGPLRSLFGRPEKPRHRRPQCPACRIQHDAAHRYLEVLLNGIEDASLSQALAASDGLCLPHMERALERGGSRAEPILARTRDVAQRLVHDLGEVIRKEDYRFRHEPRSDAERAAPRLAVTWTAGLDGLVAP